MKLIRQPSLLRRVFLACVLAFVLVWGAISVWSGWNLLRQETGALDQFMRSSGHALILQTQDAPGDASAVARFSTAARIIESLMSGPVPISGRIVQLRGAEGQLLASVPDAAAIDLPAGANGFFDTVVDGRRARGYVEATADGRLRVVTTLPVATRVALADSEIVSFDSFIPFFIAFPFVLVPIAIAVFTGLRPLRQLSAELAARRPGDLAPVSSAYVYAELAPLLEALNATLERTRGLIERERSFVADAAHELRTPLAVITAQADVLVNSHDAPGRDEAARQLSGGLQRMSRLVGQLLALARLDSGIDGAEGPAGVPPAATDLVEVIRDAIAAHVPQTQSRDIDLSYYGPDRCIIPARAGLLVSILDNLVANAVRHGRDEGRVVVALREGRQTVEVEVADDGPGIAAADRERMFERFHRGSETGSGGSGLGLAIVKAAVGALGARVELADGLDGRGLGVRVVFERKAQ